MFYPEPLDVPVTYKAINSITPHDLNLHLRQLDWTAFSTVDDDFDIEQALSHLTSNLEDIVNTIPKRSGILG